jgi:hypothetical protein
MEETRYLLVRYRECGTGNPLPVAAILARIRESWPRRWIPRLCTGCGHTLSDREMREAWTGHRRPCRPRYHYQGRGNRLFLTAHPPRPPKRRRRRRRNPARTRPRRT